METGQHSKNILKTEMQTEQSLCELTAYSSIYLGSVMN